MLRLAHLSHFFLQQRESWLRLLGIGLLLRLLLLLYIGHDPLQGDSLYYHQMGVALAQGDSWDPYWPPALPLYEAGLTLLFGSSPLVARLGMLLWFILLARVTTRLFERIHSRVAGNLALLLLCIYPEFVHHSIEPLTHIPTATLLLLLFDDLLCYTSEKKRGLLTRMGVCLGLLVLLRPASLLFVIWIPLLMLIRRRSFIGAAYVVMWASLLVSSWVYYTYEQHHRWIPVNEANARNFYLGNNPWTPDYKTWYFGSHWTGWEGNPLAFRTELAQLEALPSDEQSKAFTRQALQHITADPGTFFLRTLNRTRVFLAFDTFTGARLLQSDHQPEKILGAATLILNVLIFPLTLLMALMVMTGWLRWELPRFTRRIALAFVLSYALPYLLSFTHPTYHLPLIPLFFGFAMIPFAALITDNRKWHLAQDRRRWIYAVLTILLIALQVEWALRMMP